MDPVCGATGCRADADYVIQHPEYGRRVVCRDDVNGYEVIEYV